MSAKIKACHRLSLVLALTGLFAAGSASAQKYASHRARARLLLLGGKSTAGKAYRSVRELRSRAVEAARAGNHVPARKLWIQHLEQRIEAAELLAKTYRGMDDTFFRQKHPGATTGTAERARHFVTLAQQLAHQLTAAKGEAFQVPTFRRQKAGALVTAAQAAQYRRSDARKSPAEPKRLTHAGEGPTAKSSEQLAAHYDRMSGYLSEYAEKLETEASSNSDPKKMDAAMDAYRWATHYQIAAQQEARKTAKDTAPMDEMIGYLTKEAISNDADRAKMARDLHFNPRRAIRAAGAKVRDHFAAARSNVIRELRTGLQGADLLSAQADLVSINDILLRHQARALAQEARYVRSSSVKSDLNAKVKRLRALAKEQVAALESLYAQLDGEGDMADFDMGGLDGGRQERFGSFPERSY